MKVSNYKLIEKWGFWLTVYAFCSLFLGVLLLSQPNDLRSHLIALVLLLLCLIGGITFLYLGTKFRSGIYLCAGASMLLPVTLLGSSMYHKIMIGLVFLVPFCLLMARCIKTGSGQNQAVEKWGNRLAGFVLCVPLLACCLYFFASVAPDLSKEILPLFYLIEIAWLAVPCALVVLICMLLGAKYRSYKYLCMGLATIYLTYFTFAFVMGWAFSFMD